MRILILVSYPDIWGPLPKVTPLIVRSLRDLGCNVTTAHWGRHHDAEGWGEKVIGRLRDVAAIRRLLGESRFDLLVVTTAHDWVAVLRDIPLLVATWRRRPPTVLQFHGSQPDSILSGSRPLFRLLSRLLIRMADGVMVLSSEERDQWQTICPTGRFFVVTNPFEPPESVPPGPVRGLSVGGEPPVVLFVGRLIPEKGIFELLKAIAALLPDTPVRLMMVGSGSTEDELRRTIESLGLEHRVTLAGYLEGERLQAVYQDADLFVLPTSWSEGFPTVVSEAMAAGLPIVTTRLRGTADHLEEGINALFVPPHDPSALAAAMRRLLLDPELRATMAQANRQKVRGFAPSLVGRHYLDVLQAVQAKASDACAVSAAG
jgi:glycosyltransferase involved in cell wall biosynthesis